MVVHLDTCYFDFVVVHRHEGIPAEGLQLHRLVVAAEGELAAVLAQTQAEFFLVNDVGLEHFFKDWGLVLRVCPRQPQDPVGFLRVEKVGLSSDAAKCQVEGILTVPALAKAGLFPHQEPVVRAALSVRLAELAPVAGGASAGVLLTIVDVGSLALI